MLNGLQFIKLNVAYMAKILRRHFLLKRLAEKVNFRATVLGLIFNTRNATHGHKRAEHHHARMIEVPYFANGIVKRGIRHGFPQE